VSFPASLGAAEGVLSFRRPDEIVRTLLRCCAMPVDSSLWSIATTAGSLDEVLSGSGDALLSH
jgi:hypothetical protein